nr:hypothetical protein [uncultured bacterium]
MSLRNIAVNHHWNFQFSICHAYVKFTSKSYIGHWRLSLTKRRIRLVTLFFSYRILWWIQHIFDF